MLVEESTRISSTAAPPMVTRVVPVRLVPLMTMLCLPRVGPKFGLADVIVGVVRYVNAPVAVAVVPLAVTATSRAPMVPLGVFAVITFGETTTTRVARTPPTFTVVAPVTKLVPVIVMAVLPAIGPELGATVEIVGALP